MESGKSIIRYLPPNGTAGLATFLVSTYKRLPRPPASSMATHSFSDTCKFSFFTVCIAAIYTPSGVSLCVSISAGFHLLFRTAGCGYCLVCRYGNRFFGGFRNCLGSGACHRLFSGLRNCLGSGACHRLFSGLCNGFGAGLGYGLLGCAGNGLGAGFRNCLGRAGALYRFLGSRGFCGLDLCLWCGAWLLPCP